MRQYSQRPAARCSTYRSIVDHEVTGVYGPAGVAPRRAPAKAARQSLGRRLLHDAAFWISLIADSIALVAVVIAVFVVEKDTTVSAVLLLLALFALIALAVALIVYWRSSRSASYKHAMRGLHQAIHLLRNEMARDESWSHANRVPVVNCFGFPVVGACIVETGAAVYI